MTGAAAGSILRGVVTSNRGVRLRVQEVQAAGDGGPLTGQVVLLDAGDNKHTPVLSGMLHRATDAGEILAAIRRAKPGCVNVANKNILVLEPPETAGPGANGHDEVSRPPGKLA